MQTLITNRGSSAATVPKNVDMSVTTCEENLTGVGVNISTLVRSTSVSFLMHTCKKSLIRQRNIVLPGN